MNSYRRTVREPDEMCGGGGEGVEGGLPPMDWHPFQSKPKHLKYATETKISFGAVNHTSKTLDLARFRFLFDFL